MHKASKWLLVMMMIAAMASFMACSDDDDDDNGGTNPPPAADPWVGQWLSAGANVAPILVAVFNYDSVRVYMEDDGTVQLDTHIAGGAWSSVSGTYAVTESASGDVHSIELIYPAFSQEGIIEVIDDTMRLEAVQTVPDIGAVPRTPETGFGSDAALGTTNIQTYVRED